MNKGETKKLYQEIINLPFITREAKFEETINKFKSLTNISKDRSQYLDRKLETKEEWAKCFVKEKFAAGISTTSRVESLHKHLSQYLNSNSRLNQLFQVFREIEAKQLNKFEEELQRHLKNLNQDINKSCLFTKLQEIYSPYTLEKLDQRINKALAYRYQEVSPQKW